VTSLRQRVLDELQRRNYSSETTRGYIHAIKQFAEFFGKSPEQLGAEEIRQFQLHLLKERKLAPGTVEGRMSALRFLYKKTLKRRDIAYDDLIFPKTPRKLPVVLSPEEITRMIEAAPSLMHRTILMVLYGTGIRRTEASLLKVNDIDSERMVIHVQQGKGSRDREVPMTPKLLCSHTAPTLQIVNLRDVFSAAAPPRQQTFARFGTGSYSSPRRFRAKAPFKTHSSRHPARRASGSLLTPLSKVSRLHLLRPPSSLCAGTPPIRI
jgi:integrase